MNHKIFNLKIRTDGEPIAICKLDENGEPEYDKISLIALNTDGKEREYDIAFLGVKPFPVSCLERFKSSELEKSVDDLIQSNRRRRPFTAIKRGAPLQVYSNEDYAGIIFLGKSYSHVTRWNRETRELIPGEVLGNLKVKRYENLPKSKSDFDLLRDYLHYGVNVLRQTG